MQLWKLLSYQNLPMYTKTHICKQFLHQQELEWQVSIWNPYQLNKHIGEDSWEQETCYIFLELYFSEFFHIESSKLKAARHS